MADEQSSSMDEGEQRLRRLLEATMDTASVEQHLGDTKRVDRARSKRLARRNSAEMKQCYLNAVNVLVDTPELTDATYCEGAFVSSLMPIAFSHGWVETADGTILDPTLALPDPALGARWAIAYFLGRRYTRADLLSHCNPAGELHLPIDESALADAEAQAYALINTLRMTEHTKARTPESA